MQIPSGIETNETTTSFHVCMSTLEAIDNYSQEMKLNELSKQVLITLYGTWH